MNIWKYHGKYRSYYGYVVSGETFEQILLLVGY